MIYVQQAQLSRSVGKSPGGRICPSRTIAGTDSPSILGAVAGETAYCVVGYIAQKLAEVDGIGTDFYHW